MVQWQLCTPEHLRSSGYGRPYPRHGLQLLYWFANNCVTCELVNSVFIMRLVSRCQPENGSYGFHCFGNAEQLLPVLARCRKSNKKKQTIYYEVGNLNTETYLGSADLPAYVRENFGSDGNHGLNNIDRIIIGYQIKTRVVETVYVTEHDRTGSGRFSFERTYQISIDLIQALQYPLLDISTFLIQMGYCGQIQEYQSYNTQHMDYPEPTAQQMLQPYSGSTARTDQNYDLSYYSGAYQQQLYNNVTQFNYDQQAQARYTAQYQSELLAAYNDIYRTARYPPRGWYDFYEGFEEKAKKWKGGGGFSFIKLLLGAGALYLAVKCFSWLRSWCKVSSHELKMIPWRSPCLKHTHVMLDYVY